MNNWRDVLCGVVQVAEELAGTAYPLDDFLQDRGFNFPDDANLFVVLPIENHTALIGSLAAVTEFESEDVKDAEHF